MRRESRIGNRLHFVERQEYLFAIKSVRGVGPRARAHNRHRVLGFLEKIEG